MQERLRKLTFLSGFSSRIQDSLTKKRENRHWVLRWSPCCVWYARASETQEPGREPVCKRLKDCIHIWCNRKGLNFPSSGRRTGQLQGILTSHGCLQQKDERRKFRQKTGKVRWGINADRSPCLARVHNFPFWDCSGYFMLTVLLSFKDSFCANNCFRKVSRWPRFSSVFLFVF